MQRALLTLALAILLAGCSDSRTVAGRAACARLQIELSDYPFYENDALAIDPELLDELARASCVARDGEVELERLLFGDAPVALFDRVLERLPDDLTARSIFWVFHVSGYFGGVWLREKIVAAQPGAIIVQLGRVPSRADFDQIAADARAGLGLASASDAAVLASARESLPGLVDGFGYNKGYLLQILEAPPAGLASPPGFLTCAGPLSCDYSSPALAALASLEEIERRLAEPDTPGYAEVAALIPEVQAAAEARGRMVWSSGLSVQGFAQLDYDVLLDLSSSFLQATQATALTSFAAVAEHDAQRARRGRLAAALYDVWTGSYVVGLLDGRTDRELPRLAVR